MAQDLASGVFILYLAAGAVKAWRKFDAAGVVAPTAGQHGLLKAALMNLISPGPYLFWGLVAGPVLLEAWSESPKSGLAFLAGFYAAMIATLAGIILLFGSARQLGTRVNRALLLISAILLAGFGVYQLWMGLSRLWISG